MFEGTNLPERKIISGRLGTSMEHTTLPLLVFDSIGRLAAEQVLGWMAVPIFMHRHFYRALSIRSQSRVHATSKLLNE
jgi:hypothetical protein